MNPQTFWLPPQSSTLAPEIDGLFYFVYWASLLLFVGVIGAMVYFAWKYRRRSDSDRSPRIEENKIVEAAWVVVPTILVLAVFNWGFKTFVKISVAPPNAYEIQVRGKQWLWDFEYPNGTVTTNELYIPVDRPVKLIMTSEDVLHSFFVPEFRTKMDVVPGRYTTTWFQATRTGEMQVFCTEYCGTSHSGMLAKVIVLPQEKFNQGLALGAWGDTENVPLPELGERLYTNRGCVGCHTIDGSSKVGPTWKGLYNSNVPLQSGGSVVADEDYLRESIVNPAAQIHSGYPPVMPAYPNLSERELSGLIEYIKTLK